MKYQEYTPTNTLENIIDSYWLIKDLNQFEHQRVLPDGCSDLIFNLGKATSSIPKETIVISGMMTTFLDISLDNDSELLGIRFKPGQLSKLTSHPLFEIKNKTIEASELIPSLDIEKLEELESQKSLKNRLKYIEHIIYQIINNNKKPNDPLITSVTDFILHSSESVNIEKLAKRFNISLRQLERKFKHNVGVTMKEFTRITRFNQTKKNISDNPDQSLLHIAFDFGYYDHSHLTNEFRHFSGQIPSDFR